MSKVFVLSLGLTLLSALAASAEEGVVVEKGVVVEEGTAAKMISGMSIVGNDEAPKVLYIVPWKSSEIGAETGLNRMLTESAMPVDREVFMRQLDYFAVSTAEPGKAE